MAGSTEPRVIIGTVAADGHSNLGNGVIHRATLAALDLPPTAPAFSLFEPMTEALAARINAHDLVVFTGCTILQASPGHQRFFNEWCGEIRIPRVCVAGAFCCDENDRPPVDLARWFTAPITTRDPWTSDYLSRHGIANRLVGCPTLLTDAAYPSNWVRPMTGVTLFSSTPHLVNEAGLTASSKPIRFVRHEAGIRGMDIRSPRIFDGVRQCITGRLHLALPAVARGIPTRFFGPDHWSDKRVGAAAGRSRLSLLRLLGISLHGDVPGRYPREELMALRESFLAWRRECAV